MTDTVTRLWNLIAAAEAVAADLECPDEETDCAALAERLETALEEARGEPLPLTREKAS